jgi:large subunit ribosomal protein L23
MKLVKGKQKQLPNVATFQVSMEMTKHDVKNYLEKIYKIPVVDVVTEIHTGTIFLLLKNNYVYWS